MSKPNTSRIESFDGTALAVHQLGEGRPVVLLHGLFSSAEMNWLRFGHAEVLARAGYRAIMPDLRAHGESDAPHDPVHYPHGVLSRDLQAIIAAFELDDFDLVGFSLGARAAISGVIDGVAPRRLVLVGMGLEGLIDWKKRGAFFRDAIERFDTVKRDDPAFMAVQFMKTMGVDRTAAALLLASVSNITVDDLARVKLPTLVLSGDKDNDNGSAEALTDALPQARHETISGTHMSSVTDPALAQKMVAFLAE